MLTKKQKAEYQKEYRRKHRNKLLAYHRAYSLAHKEENRKKYKGKGWLHYTKGRKCSKCEKPILNISRTGKCKYCCLRKDVHVDLKSKIYRDKYPERVKARLMLGDHVRRGKIKRGKCLFCNSRKTEGHHEDYSKPLDVIWVCKPHHAAMEATERLVHKIMSGEKLSAYQVTRINKIRHKAGVPLFVQ